MTYVPQSIPYADSRPAQLPFRDRRTSLRVMGVLLIVIGSLAVLSALVMPASYFMMKQMASTAVRGGVRPPPGMELGLMLQNELTYIAGAVFFLMLGIGSVRLHRWVRPVILALGWPGLVIGVLMTAWVIIFFLPNFKQNFQAQAGGAALPANFAVIMVVIVSVIIVVIYIGLPALFVWYFRKPDVAATLAYFDQRPVRWTDNVPLPLLGISLILVVSAFASLYQLPFPIVPFFGAILSGPLAVAGLLAMSLLMLVLARATLQRRPAAWWAIVAVVILGAVSGLLTYAKHSTDEMLVAAGHSAEMIKAAGALDEATSGMEIVVVATVVLSIVYLMYARQFFRNASPMAHQPAAELPPL